MQDALARPTGARLPPNRIPGRTLSPTLARRYTHGMDESHNRSRFVAGALDSARRVFEADLGSRVKWMAIGGLVGILALPFGGPAASFWQLSLQSHFDNEWIALFYGAGCVAGRGACAGFFVHRWWTTFCSRDRKRESNRIDQWMGGTFGWRYLPLLNDLSTPKLRNRPGFLHLSLLPGFEPAHRVSMLARIP